MEVEKGKIPASFYTKNLLDVIPDLYIVAASMDPGSIFQKPNAQEVAKVTGRSYTAGNYTSFDLTVSDDFVVGSGKRVCMAHPAICECIVGSFYRISRLETARPTHFPENGRKFPIRGHNFLL